MNDTAIHRYYTLYTVAGRRGGFCAVLPDPVIAAPYFKKHGKRPGLIAFVYGTTVAAVGAIAGSVVVLAQRSITDMPTAALALGTAVLLRKAKKAPGPIVVLTAALIGLVIYPLMHR